MKTKKPNIGVIGVGHLGQYHTKHYKSITQANLVGVYDADHTRGNEMLVTKCVDFGAKLNMILNGENDEI